MVRISTHEAARIDRKNVGIYYTRRPRTELVSAQVIEIVTISMPGTAFA